MYDVITSNLLKNFLAYFLFFSLFFLSFSPEMIDALDS